MLSGLDLELLGTGNTALDAILGGGIPVRSVNVIAGLPGTGKTLCTLQMLFHFAREGRKSLYFTTMSEPTVKLLRYIQSFAFFKRNAEFCHTVGFNVFAPCHPVLVQEIK